MALAVVTRQLIAYQLTRHTTTTSLKRLGDAG